MNIPDKIGNMRIKKHDEGVSIARLRPIEVVEYLDNRPDLVRESLTAHIWWNVTSKQGKRILATATTQVNKEGLAPGTKQASSITPNSVPNSVPEPEPVLEPETVPEPNFEFESE